MRRPDVIPQGWAEAHRAVAAATMTAATCTVRGKDVKVTDPVSGLTTLQPGPVIVGPSDPAEWAQGRPCRVQRTDRALTTTTATAQVINNAYMIGLPYTDAVIVPGCQIEILTSDDARLTGRKFTVTTELTGSLVWERDLWAVDNESN